jgi:hypothetical protein
MTQEKPRGTEKERKSDLFAQELGRAELRRRGRRAEGVASSAKP